MKKLAAAAALGLATGALALAGPASATGQDAPPPLTITSTVHDDCGATFTFTNNTNFHYWGDWNTLTPNNAHAGTPDDQFPPLPPDPADYGHAHDHGVNPDQTLTNGPFAGQPFGTQFNPVLLPPGTSVDVEVHVDEIKSAHARIWRGPDQENYVSWVHALKIKPCPEPNPTPKPTPKPTATATEPPADGEGGEADDGDDKGLPVTGMSTGIMVGGAVALLVVGGGLYLVARRRRTSFTS